MLARGTSKGCFDVRQNRRIKIYQRVDVRDNILTRGCYEFLRLLSLNSLGLISQLERRGIIFSNLEVGFLFNKSDQISQPLCMNHLNI